MEELSYKTRGQSLPHGKPRVYFSCHPSDFSKYFDTVTEDILQYHNCTVYYREPSDASDFYETDEYDRLSQMQLFVIPVTSKLLTEPNRTVGFDLGYALAHHIPVLPLMQERGLEALFSMKFGDLQFLDKNNRDATAIGYDEKLSNFLESVLIGDELALKVRNAFDAYIFLSYRKKDRRYAQELMRLIHEIDFCRDIAIWYDEFLTPGRDFRASIQSALEKSSLFVLTVTPHLLENGNFVMVEEYPMAYRLQKSILPVEMLPTDRPTLAEKYDHIDQAVDPNDSVTLSAELKARLCGISRLSSNNDPEHLYYMGLAYLGGVDVEVNHMRAAGLITSAAENGCADAMEKLAHMYHIGEGVEKDYLAEVKWLEKLTEQAQINYSEHKDLSAGQYYYDKLAELGVAWSALRKYIEAADVYKRGLYLLKELVLNFGVEAAEKQLMLIPNVLIVLGDIAHEQKDFTSARKYYSDAYEIIKSASELERVESKWHMSYALDRMGNMYKEEGRLEEAEDSYLASFQLIYRLVRTDNSVQARYRLAESYARLGEINFENQKFNEATDYYKSAMKLWENLSDEIGSDEILLNLAFCYNKLGYLYRADFNLSNAEKYFQSAHEIILSLAEESGSIEHRNSLLVSYQGLAEIYLAASQFSMAEEACRTAITIAEELINETDLIELRRSYAQLYMTLGDIETAQKNITKASLHYRRAYRIIERYVKEIGSVAFRTDFALCCIKLGLIVSEQYDYEAAMEYGQTALNHFQSLYRELHSIELRAHLATVYHLLGKICEDTGDNSAATYYQMAIAEREALLELSDTAMAAEGLIESYLGLASACIQQDQYANAQVALENAYSLSEQVVQNASIPNSLNMHAIICLNLGLLRRDRDLLMRAYDILKSHSEQFGSNPALESTLKMIREKIADLDE